MDWMNRGAQNGQAAGQAAGTNVSGTGKAKRSRGDKMRFVSLTLLVSGAILLIALIAYMVLGVGAATENKNLDKTKLQAVFLNGGQVYFGKIKDLNEKYLSMDSIYYLRVNQSVQPNQATSTNSNDVSLVKLGCELHGPQDRMVINREQVIFWENLKDDGQVAKAVATYKEQNPDGQKCDTANSSSTPTTGTGTSTGTGTGSGTGTGTGTSTGTGNNR